MIPPFKALGIELKGHWLSKRKLTEWTKHNTPHTVLLYAKGGVFTSKGDGIYESTDMRFESLDEFWQHARNFKSAVMWEGRK